VSETTLKFGKITKGIERISETRLAEEKEI